MDLTPEEEVRQLLALRLLGLGYERDDLRLNFTVRFGSQPKYLDVGIFHRSVGGGDRYVQQKVLMIAECKRRGITPKMFAEARGQLESYLSACPNALFGIVTDGERTTVLRRGREREPNGHRGPDQFIEIPDIPRPEEAEATPPTFAFDAPAENVTVRAPEPATAPAPVAPPAPAPALIRLVARIPSDGKVSLPDGTFTLPNDLRKANPPQPIRLERTTYWCYEKYLFAVADEGMPAAEIRVRVAHFAETERARRDAASEQKAQELAVLAREAERLRGLRQEAYARSPEGLARAEAERARKEEEARKGEAENARRRTDEARLERMRGEEEVRREAETKARRHEEEERLERVRREEEGRRFQQQARERDAEEAAEEARKDAENPRWREDQARLREAIRRDDRWKDIKILLWAARVFLLPPVVVVLSFVAFGLWAGLVSLLPAAVYMVWAFVKGAD